MAGRPLRPATDRRLGEPLPHLLANPISAAPKTRGPCGSPAFPLRAYAVLAQLSLRYPPFPGTFRYITHPFATRHQGCPRAAVRLACVKHAASVQSEPGSNSSVQSLLLFIPSLRTERSHSKRINISFLQLRVRYCFYVLRPITIQLNCIVISTLTHVPTLVGCL